MLNQKWLKQGAGVAVGVFLASAVVVPLISDRSFGYGLRRGLVTAAIVLVIYVAIAALKKDRHLEERGDDNASTGGTA